MSDWRADNAQGLKGFVFQRRVYRAPRPDWDHDHCEGCMAKFAECDGEDILHEGNASYAKYKDRRGYCYWVCAECFTALKDELRWSISSI